jgi:hypothetical protein
MFPSLNPMSCHYGRAEQREGGRRRRRENHKSPQKDCQEAPATRALSRAIQMSPLWLGPLGKRPQPAYGPRDRFPGPGPQNQQDSGPEHSRAHTVWPPHRMSRQVGGQACREGHMCTSLPPKGFGAYPESNPQVQIDSVDSSILRVMGSTGPSRHECSTVCPITWEGWMRARPDRSTDARRLLRL